MISRSRTNLACRKLIRKLWEKYGKFPSDTTTDGGPWYIILERYSIAHKVVSGGLRNYVERVSETLKDRTRIFEHYFPQQKMENAPYGDMDVTLYILL